VGRRSDGGRATVDGLLVGSDGAHMTTGLHVVERGGVRFPRRSRLPQPLLATCSCGEEVAAMADWRLADPYTPIQEAFAKHRKAAGVPAGRADQAISTRIRDEGFRFGRKAR
jgi:hypothetical protein